MDPRIPEMPGRRRVRFGGIYVAKRVPLVWIEKTFWAHCAKPALATHEGALGVEGQRHTSSAVTNHTADRSSTDHLQIMI